MYKKISHRKADGTHYEENAIIFIETNTYIPFDPANKDYQEYLKWLEEGNTPEPADEVDNG